MPDVMSSSRLGIRPVASRIGAEVEGIDLARELDDGLVGELGAALLRHRVLFFRNQHLDDRRHVALAAQFGQPVVLPAHDGRTAANEPAIYAFGCPRSGAGLELRDDIPTSGWRSDGTQTVNPPWASIVRAAAAPAVGGDTHWTNLVAAYEALPASLRELADGLRAEHRLGGDAIRTQRPSGGEAQASEMPAIAHHSLVRVLPETAERALAINPVLTSRILDVSHRESEILLDMYFAQLSRPEHTVRFHWDAESVVLWDNRATAYLDPCDFDDDSQRVLYGVSLTGDVPVGPDGRRSEAAAGEPLTPASTQSPPALTVTLPSNTRESTRR